MNLAGPIRYWSRRMGDRAVFVMDDRTVTWRELDERTSRLAQGLMSLGVRKGDRVALLTTNCIEFCETVLAVLKMGAILVPLNYRLAPSELDEIVQRSGTSLIVGYASLLGPLAELAGPKAAWRGVVIRQTDDAPAARLEAAAEYEALIAESDPVDPMATFPPEHPAFICYTSGTTGLPKGAVLSHRNVMGTALERITCDEWNSSDVGYIPYAIAFTGGLVSMWMPLYVAGSIVVLDASFEAERALSIIEQHKVTAFIAVGAVLMAMATSPAFEAADLSSLTTLATGGQPIPVELVRHYARKGLPLAQQYGLTEGGGLNLILPGDQAISRIGSTGLATPQCEARILDPDGKECAVGDVGELVIRGPQVMERYWDDPTTTAETIVDGWLHTGDLARVDADGYFEIVDRKKDMLISGGLNIYPAEIERVLAEVGALEEAAVIGVPDPRWGEVPVVVARPRAVTSEQEILDFCRDRLGRYKVPKRVILREAPLPRGMSGKVLKKELRAEYDSIDTEA